MKHSEKRTNFQDSDKHSLKQSIINSKTDVPLFLCFLYRYFICFLYVILYVSDLYADQYSACPNSRGVMGAQQRSADPKNCLYPLKPAVALRPWIEHNILCRQQRNQNNQDPSNSSIDWGRSHRFIPGAVKSHAFQHPQRLREKRFLKKDEKKRKRRVLYKHKYIEK